MDHFKIFVEGKDDKRFIEDFLLHIGIAPGLVDVQITGGWTNLKQSENEFKKNTFLDGTNIIIFDADSNLKVRKSEILSEIDRLKLTTKLFIMPNNQDSGNLDTLLIDIANPINKSVFDCFDGYNNCLANAKQEFRICTKKEKIYAYCAALNSEPKIERRNYRDENLWNLNHIWLTNLKAFLLENLKSN